MMVDLTILVIPVLEKKLLFKQTNKKIYLSVSIYVWTRTSMKGRRRLKISQTSIILTYEVFGKLFETLMNIVVSTSIATKENSTHF